MRSIHKVKAKHWDTWVDEHGAIILDVRTPMEWAQGTLPGTTRIGMTELAERHQTLDPATPVLVVCRSGSRSATAARFLASQGFATVGNLTGGLQALGKAA